MISCNGYYIIFVEIDRETQALNSERKDVEFRLKKEATIK